MSLENLEAVLSTIDQSWKVIRQKAPCPFHKKVEECPADDPCARCAARNMMRAALSILRPENKPFDIVHYYGKLISKRHNITYNELMGRETYGHITKARKELYVALFVEANFSAAEVARRLGRHHTSVISGIISMIGEIRYRELVDKKFPNGRFKRRVAA